MVLYKYSCGTIPTLLCVQIALDVALMQHLRAPGEADEHPETLAARILAVADNLASQTMLRLHDSPSPAIIHEMV